MRQVLGVVIGSLLALQANAVWAATTTATVTVSANIPSRAELKLERDPNSVARFAASQLVFDRVDDQDPGVAGPNANFMYAPYRSETGKNWHVVRILSNASRLTLTASVTGSAGGGSLADILNVFSGGFFAEGSSSPLSGTKSGDWEPLNGFTRNVEQAFTGTVPMNYRLDIAGIGAGTYSGNITYTLTTQ